MEAGMEHGSTRVEFGGIETGMEHDGSRLHEAACASMLVAVRKDTPLHRMVRARRRQAPCPLRLLWKENPSRKMASVVERPSEFRKPGRSYRWCRAGLTAGCIIHSRLR